MSGAHIRSRVAVGDRHGRLTVISQCRDGRGRRAWLCGCDCGEAKVVSAGNLTFGMVRSCGCLRREVMAKLGGDRVRTHGRSKTLLYRVWSSMKQRCTNPKAQAYKYYGARGIKVCERWMTFENFAADMGLPPTAEFSLDRIDNDGNYEPSNCRWATSAEQVQNRRPRDQWVSSKR